MSAISLREIIAAAIRSAGRANSYNKALFILGDIKREGYVILSPDEVRGMTLGAAEAFAALDLADSLIERAYGTETPREWHKAFRQVAKARSLKGGRDAN